MSTLWIFNQHPFLVVFDESTAPSSTSLQDFSETFSCLGLISLFSRHLPTLRTLTMCSYWPFCMPAYAPVTLLARVLCGRNSDVTAPSRRKAELHGKKRSATPRVAAVEEVAVITVDALLRRLSVGGCTLSARLETRERDMSTNPEARCSFRHCDKPIEFVARV